MKLANFLRVSELRGDREYFAKVRDRALADHRVRSIKLGDYDLRPALVEKLLPELRCVCEMEIRRVDEELAKLGVEV